MTKKLRATGGDVACSLWLEAGAVIIVEAGAGDVLKYGGW